MLCNGCVARMAAIFPLKLCRAILGLRNQLRNDGALINGHVGMQEYEVDAKMNTVHDDACAYNLDGTLSTCVGEDVVETTNGQTLKFDNGE